MKRQNVYIVLKQRKRKAQPPKILQMVMDGKESFFRLLLSNKSNEYQNQMVRRTTPEGDEERQFGRRKRLPPPTRHQVKNSRESTSEGDTSLVDRRVLSSSSQVVHIINNLLQRTR